MSAPIRWLGAEAALECGERFHVDLRTGAVIGRADDLVGIGQLAPRIRREYDSRAVAQSPSLGAGWFVAHEGLASARAGRDAHLDVRVRAETYATIEATVRRARVCVRFFEVSGGQLVRVRDEREQVIEEYEYDGPLLVAARTCETPWRYFEYDDRGRRARCVRTWSATGKRDRRITYAGAATVVDDATGATWIVERGGPQLSLLDPEMRRTSPSDAVHAASAPASEIDFDTSGAIVALGVPGFGRLAAKTDAAGRVTELRANGGDSVAWTYDRAVTTARASDGSWIEVSSSGLVREVHDASSGRALSARYDDDRSLVSLSIDGVQVVVENDPEGRPIELRRAGGRARTILRDRAGRAVALEAEDGGRRDLDGSWRSADDEITRCVLEWSVNAAGTLAGSAAEGAFAPEWFRPSSTELTQQHVRTVLAHARGLGRFAPAS